MAGTLSLAVGLQVVLSGSAKGDAFGLGPVVAPLLFFIVFVVFLLYAWLPALALTLMGCGAIPALRRRTSRRFWLFCSAGLAVSLLMFFLASGYVRQNPELVRYWPF